MSPSENYSNIQIWQGYVANIQANSYGALAQFAPAALIADNYGFEFPYINKKQQ